MRKKRGFTLIEIVVTFSLISVITLLLFEIIISLRELYIKGDLQTTLLSKQGILTKKLSNDLEELKLKSITDCGPYCITFNYQMGVSYNLSLDPEKMTIQYHDYTWELPEGSKIGTVQTSIYKDASITNIDLDNAILKIEIPVTHKLLEKNYGLSLIHQYNSNVAVVPSMIPKPASITDEQHQHYSFFR